jgi:hypothetical protein
MELPKRHATVTSVYGQPVHHVPVPLPREAPGQAAKLSSIRPRLALALLSMPVQFARWPPQA